MKMNITGAFVIFFIGYVSFAQDYKNSNESIKIVDTQIEEGEYNTTGQNPSNNVMVKNFENQSYAQFYSRKKFKKIKRQMRKAKRRAERKNLIRSRRVIDTIRIEIPSFNKKPLLSGW